MSEYIAVIVVYSIPVIFGLGLIYIGLREYFLIRKIEDIPPSKVNAAPVGLVKLSGTAQTINPEKSPVNGIPCVFWKVTGNYFYKGKHSGWREFYSVQQKGPFFIADGTGRMAVAPEGAEMNIPSHISHKGYISAEQGWFNSHGASLDGRALKFIESLEGDSRARFLAHKEEEICVAEYVIREHDPLFVLGTATPDDTSPSQGDRNGLVIRKGSTDKTLYIAETGEGYVIDQLSILLYVGLIGGFGILAITVFFILSRLGV